MLRLLPSKRTMITSLGPPFTFIWFVSEGAADVLRRFRLCPRAEGPFRSGRTIEAQETCRQAAPGRLGLAVAFHLEDAGLHVDAVAVDVERAARIDHAVAREEERYRIARHGLTDGAGGVRMTDFASDPTVRTHFARRNLGRFVQREPLESGQFGVVDPIEIDAPRPEIVLNRLADPSGCVGGAQGTAQTAFDQRADGLGVLAAIDPDERNPALTPGDEEFAERRSQTTEVVGDGVAVVVAHRLDVVENLRNQARGRLDDRQAREAVRYPFELMIEFLAVRAAAQVSQHVFSARLDAFPHLVPERFDITAPHSQGLRLALGGRLVGRGFAVGCARPDARATSRS